MITNRDKVECNNLCKFVPVGLSDLVAIKLPDQKKLCIEVVERKGALLSRLKPLVQ